MSSNAARKSHHGRGNKIIRDRDLVDITVQRKNGKIQIKHKGFLSLTF